MSKARNLSDFISDPTISSTEIADLAVTHAKLHGTMDLSSKTVTLPTLSTTLNISRSDDARLVLTDTGDSCTFMVRSDGANTSIGTDTAHPVRFMTNNTERMRIDSSGNVGIGQSVPVNRLHVSGADGYAYLKLTSDSTGHTAADGSRIGLNGSDLRIINAEAASILFQTQNSERMRIASSGNVGIGTSSPSSQFFNNLVVGNNDAGDKGITIRSNASNRGVLAFSDTDSATDGRYSGFISYDHNDNTMKLHTNGGTERLRLKSNGSFEIGYAGAALQQADNQAMTITTPASGGGKGIALKRLDSNSDQQLGEITWSNNTQDGQASIRVKTEGAVNTTDMHFDVNNAGSAANSALIIAGNGGGTVGIGVTPYADSKVTIGGTVPSYSSVLMFDNNTAGGAEFFMLASDNTWSAGAGNFYMGHGAPSSGNIDMSIDGAGWIVAKEKAFIATSSTQRETFYNSGDGAGLYRQNAYSSCGTHMEISNNAAHGWSNVYLHKYWSSGQDQRMMAFSVNSSTVGSITVNGSSTSYATSSDYRLKENVVGLTGASARVNQLNPSRFNFIADDTNTLVDGFLAHEVATVVPEAITGTHDGMKDEEYEVTPAVFDDDGNETAAAVMGTRSVPDYQGIDQSKLVPLLTAALQEALAEIAALKTRVEALE